MILEEWFQSKLPHQPRPPVSSFHSVRQGGHRGCRVRNIGVLVWLVQVRHVPVKEVRCTCAREYKYGVQICRAGQNHIYTVCIRYFWQGNHQIYGHIRCIYTVLASPTNMVDNYVHLRFIQALHTGFTDNLQGNTHTYTHTRTHTQHIHTHILEH